MITFKSPQDLNKLPSSYPTHSVIKELIDQLIRAYTWEGHPYIAEDYGYIILIEPQDTDRVLDEIWDDWTLLCLVFPSTRVYSVVGMGMLLFLYPLWAFVLLVTGGVAYFYFREKFL